VRTRVVRTVSHCFAVLRQTASGLSIEDVPYAYFGARLDPAGLCQQCIGWSTCIPRSAGLERVSAPYMYGLRRHDHVSDMLITLHWLKFPARINFKLAVLIHWNLHGAESEYPGPQCGVFLFYGRKTFDTYRLSCCWDRDSYIQNTNTYQQVYHLVYCDH
jgi:hypothetical protein